MLVSCELIAQSQKRLIDCKQWIFMAEKWFDEKGDDVEELSGSPYTFDTFFPCFPLGFKVGWI